MRNNPDFLYYQVRNHREHAREFKKEERKKTYRSIERMVIHQSNNLKPDLFLLFLIRS